MLYMVPLHTPAPPSPNPNPAPLRPRPHFQCHCRPQWGANAESVRTSRFRPGGGGAREEGKKEEKRKWWSDDTDDEYDSFEDDDDDDDFGFFDDEPEESFWDKFWILKVFKAYGIFLPAIIGSMLLVNGPKAFLMALAIPLGQSAISILLEYIWGKKEGEVRRSRRRSRRPFAKQQRGGFNRSKEREEGNNDNRRSYRSWVSSEDAYTGSQRSGLGGWDELDENYERGEPVRKLSKRTKYKEAPLFMRLLVAVFPFLGSWFRIL